MALADTRSLLRSRLGDAISRGAESPWTEDEFDRLALEIFRYQSGVNPVYGRYARNRGADPDGISGWRDVPPVPARAFKEIPGALVAPGPVERVFRTSGTTGAGQRGEHRVRELSLYRASFLATATTFLRPEIPAPSTPESAEDPAPGGDPGNRQVPPLRVLALLPDSRELPDSSLCCMVGGLVQAWDDGRGGFFAGPDWSLRIEDWEHALARAAQGDVPVLLIGTAFSIASWLESRGPGSLAPLPVGSLAVETGGYKGRVRGVTKDELYAGLSEVTGLPQSRILAEYGMTEMLSQVYDTALGSAGGAERPIASPSERTLAGPPWLRTRVLDPVSLEPVPVGTPGILCHHDLANLDSVSAILTEDEGVEVEGGIRLIGRIGGAEPRGCSLSMEALMAGDGAGP